ncbi:MAG: flagellar biosynthesis anti-sigma factor FlgM [Sphingomonas sp.]|nr:flagellar biosynthesis anti-sigma factor FlgM [Sphingomonas sp.]
MVDRITAAPATATDRVAAGRLASPRAQAPASAPAPAEPAATPTPAPAARATAGAALQALVTDLAVRPPVNEERVARIRQAIANGTYPISPENVADRLIALRLNWIPA